MGEEIEMISISHWGLFSTPAFRKLSDAEVIRFKALWEEQHNSYRPRILLLPDTSEAQAWVE
jgi:hypothetical protein